MYNVPQNHPFPGALRVSEEKRAFTRAELHACCQTWQKTLEHFGIHRGISPLEEIEIARSLQRWKNFDFVEHALYGAMFEEKTTCFDPAKHVSIRRVLGKDDQGQDRADKFANLGYQRRHIEKRTEEEKTKRAEEPGMTPTGPNEAAAKIREIAQGVFGRGPKK